MVGIFTLKVRHLGNVVRQLCRTSQWTRVCLALPQFACDTKSLAQCVAEKLNTSVALVTPCLIRSLNVSVEGGLEICPSQGPSCPFPEVSSLYVTTSQFVFPTQLVEPFQRENVTFTFVSLWDLLLIIPLCDAALLFVPVFQLQCAADAAGLLSVPADQQHREAGPHAAHPAHLSAIGGVATSSTIRQRRPLCHLQCHVSATGWMVMWRGVGTQDTQAYFMSQK